MRLANLFLALSILILQNGITGCDSEPRKQVKYIPQEPVKPGPSVSQPLPSATQPNPQSQPPKNDEDGASIPVPQPPTTTPTPVPSYAPTINCIEGYAGHYMDLALENVIKKCDRLPALAKSEGVSAASVFSQLENLRYKVGEIGLMSLDDGLSDYLKTVALGNISTARLAAANAHGEVLKLGAGKYPRTAAEIRDVDRCLAYMYSMVTTD